MANLNSGRFVKSFLKIISEIFSIVSIIIFFFGLKLWINNDPLLFKSNGYIMWGIYILISGWVALLMMKYSSSNLLAKITLIITILSIGLLILTGIIFSITSSMP
jgi:hypothetical protein